MFDTTDEYKAMFSEVAQRLTEKQEWYEAYRKGEAAPGEWQYIPHESQQTKTNKEPPVSALTRSGKGKHMSAFTRAGKQPHLSKLTREGKSGVVKKSK